jgi:hypothetical protein
MILINMMSLNKYILLIVIATFAIASCKKSSQPGTKPLPKGDTDVYVVGFVGSGGPSSIAAYWKNSVETKLAGNTQISSANAIAISGDDVYIAGAVSNSNSSFPVACYWKNGIQVKLSDSLPVASANAIAVVGNDVYVAGTLNFKATLWKNGVATTLDNQVSYAYGIAVNGADVYVVGYVSDNSKSFPTVWKNGVENKLSDDLYGSIIYGIGLSGNNIYMVGADNDMATIWKNGVPAAFDSKSSSSELFGMTISGPDVYVVRNSVCGYWKNGTETVIPGYGFPDAIAVAGSDVYTAGNIPTEFSSNEFVCYWKNKTLHQFGDGGGALGIAVVVH